MTSALERSCRSHCRATAARRARPSATDRGLGTSPAPKYGLCAGPKGPSAP
ncbi:hypothetical protein EIO_3002 (plasmid) [Ketogulonicigenium vulgare Y25]|nr:hypothetical protein EIO_3002 [Ketogulonicigenium vulgare Y25]